jgi:two-component system OmpR family response regulator
MTHILIIDDDAELSGMLTEYLAGEGFETTTVSNGNDGITAAMSDRFSAVILDVMMPGLSGIEVLHEIRRKSAVPVIMLTAKDSDIDRVVGLEMGADDYIAKPYYPRELVARLRAVLRRQTPDSAGRERKAEISGLSYSRARREAAWRGQPIELTATEFNMLGSLLEAGDTVMTKDELSKEVLGRARAAYDRGIDVHISNLRRKLAVVSGGALEIETIRGVGYRLKAQS